MACPEKPGCLELETALSPIDPYGMVQRSRILMARNSIDSRLRMIGETMAATRIMHPPAYIFRSNTAASCWGLQFAFDRQLGGQIRETQGEEYHRMVGMDMPCTTDADLGVEGGRVWWCLLFSGKGVSIPSFSCWIFKLPTTGNNGLLSL